MTLITRISKKRGRTPPMRHRESPPEAKPQGPLVTVAEYCRQSGRTEPAIRTLIYTKWKVGKHYWRRPGGRRLMLDVKAIEEYFRGF